MQDRKPRRPGDGSKIAGAGWVIPAKELHHWWPKGISKFWADEQGLVTRLSSAGELLRLSPEKFGALANAHAIKVEGPWNCTIEPIFDFADSNLPPIVASILAAYSSVPALNDVATTPVPSRLRAYSMTVADRAAFSEGLASLVIRSPEYRNRIRLNTNHYRKAFGLPEVDERDGLIAGNIHQWYSMAVTDFRNAHLLLLYSRTREFIFGEGYLNNVAGTTFTHKLRAVLPLTPELAVIAFTASGGCPPAQVCSLFATGDEVSEINELTQIYTKEYVFFRSQQPSISPEFSRNQFLQLQYHQAAIVEDLISASCRVNSRGCVSL